MTPEEQLAELVRLGVGQACINAFRRANGLHSSEPVPVRVVTRPVVAVSAPRKPIRKTRKKITKATVATSKSRVATRFDLDF